MIGSIDYSSIENCPLCDDWMFGKIFSNEDVLRTFLESLLNIQIGRIVIHTVQESESAGPYFRGIRADVYAKDTDTFLFNVEMQNRNEGILEKRIRFQQAVMDSQSLNKGQSTESLRESYIIFVCNFDYYQQGNAVYERISYIGNQPLLYDDGSHILILNSKYIHSNTNLEICEFLSNLNRPMCEIEGRTRLMQKIESAFGEIKMNPALMNEYLTYGSRFRATRNEDAKKVAKYVPLEVLAEIYDLTLEEAQQYIDEAKGNSLGGRKNNTGLHRMTFD